jgi:hypothetical protein
VPRARVQVFPLLFWMLVSGPAEGQITRGERLWGEAAALLGGPLDRIWASPVGPAEAAALGIGWERRFGLLEGRTLGFVGPLGGRILGAGLSDFGAGPYRELRFRLLGGYPVSPGLWTGLYGEIRQRWIDGYGRFSMFALGGGLYWVRGPWRAVMLASPLLGSAWSDREREPRRLRLAVARNLGPLELASGWEAAPGERNWPSWGLALQARPDLRLGLGTRLFPGEWGLGAELSLRGLTLSWALVRHLELGWSPSVEVSWRLKP